MQWINPKLRLPPQGKKILWFKDGDCHVVQRFGKYWLPIPFCDSRFAHFLEPELWCDIIIPKPFEGKIQVMVGDEMYDMDTLEKTHNDVYRDMVDTILRDFIKCRKQRDEHP